MTPSERFTDRERFAVASAIRDWIHEQPWSLCNAGCDTCPDWEKAYEIRDVALDALTSAHKPGKEGTDV